MFGSCFSAPAAQAELAELLKGGAEQEGVLANPHPHARQPGIAEGSDL